MAIQTRTADTFAALRQSGFVDAVLSAALVGTAYIASKVALASLDVASFVVIWFLCATTYITAYTTWRRRWRRLAALRGCWKPVLGIGLLNAAAGLLFFRAVQMIEPSIVSFVDRFGVLYTVLLGVVFLRERLNRLEILGGAVTVCGALLLSYGSEKVVVTAIMIAVLGSFAYSITMLLAKMVVKDLGPLVLTGMRAVQTCLYVALYAAARGTFQFPAPQTLAVIAVGALFSPFLSFIFLFRSLSRMEVSKATMITSSQPLFVLLYSAIFLHSIPGPRQLIGGFVILGGVLLLLAAQSQAANQSRVTTGSCVEA